LKTKTTACFVQKSSLFYRCFSFLFCYGKLCCKRAFKRTAS
jgi:hypothetical protein